MEDACSQRSKPVEILFSALKLYSKREKLRTSQGPHQVLHPVRPFISKQESRKLPICSKHSQIKLNQVLDKSN